MNTDPIVAALKEEAQLWLAADDHDFNRGIARAWLRLAENLEARLTPPPAPAPAAQAALASVPTRSCGHPAGCLDPAGRCRWCDDRKLLFKAGEAIERLGREYEATKKPAPESDWRGKCEIRRSIMHDGYYASVFCGGKTWYLCEGNVWRHDPANDASENTQMFPSESAARAALDKADPPPGVVGASKEADDRGDWFAKARKAIDPCAPSNRIWGCAADLARGAYSAGLAAAKPRRWPEGYNDWHAQNPGHPNRVHYWIEVAGGWYTIEIERLKDGDWWLPQPPAPEAAR